MFKAEEDIEAFKTLVKQFDTMASEMETLSKKTPDGAMNKFKLSLINTLLDKTNYFLDPDPGSESICFGNKNLDHRT